MSTCVRVWNMGSLIHGKAAAFAGISLKVWHTSDPHRRESDAETWHGNCWLSYSFRCRVFSGLWLKFRHNWDLQSSTEWAFWILMKPTVTSCDSLWMYHSSPGRPQARQISHQSVCTPVRSALYIFVCFILIMFSLTLNQWTQCTLIYHDTSPLGAGGSSCSGLANIWIYSWSVCEGHR